MKKYSTAIIGGGAAGIMAAIAAARLGKSVILCEKMPQPGKKILASGNGRCNLANDDLAETHYNSTARPLVASIFSQCGKSKILAFFNELGLQTYSDRGRIFPVTNQASSVLKVLDMEIKRLSVPVEPGFNCSNISITKNGFQVLSDSGKQLDCDRIVLAGGGKTYPALGSDGTTYELARKLGHSLVEPVPAAVPLLVKDSLCQVLQGQKVQAAGRSLISGQEGRQIQGELLFTQYGLSGTLILDLSEEISVAINRDHRTDVWVLIDLVPFMSREKLEHELEKRISNKWPDEEILVGILPNKFATAHKSLSGENGIKSAADLLKRRPFKVTGTRGWNEAEFTAGGVAISEVNPVTLESKIRNGCYFAGEILDVNGMRGGYNLAWAWASGFIAGQTR